MADTTTNNATHATDVVVDASAMVDLLLGTDEAAAVAAAVTGRTMAAPAHLDAEVTSALGRLHRSGVLGDDATLARIERLATAPIRRAPLAPLLVGAWARRHDTRLADALYLQLATELDTVVITTDRRLARAHPSRTRVPDPPT